VGTFYKYIEKKTELLLRKMDRGEIEITHDFYLKKFQLSNPQLNYEYILFDEGQDASVAMLDIFLKQKAVKVIVGDSNQQIYGWRYAVNSLEKADFATYNLSTSFRFGKEIANLAVEVLNYKKHIERNSSVKITGKGDCQNVKTKAILARTNLGLLVQAIEYVTQKENVRHIYFEGNINSYTYADEGASLYDVLNLSNRKHSLIRDKLIRSMKDLRDLEDYIKKTEDLQLSVLVELVKKYGNRIHGIMKTIKEKHVSNEEKEKAEIIFSTVHRSKGMEYDIVTLVDDFVAEKTLLNFKEGKNQRYTPEKLSEEINLLYVAITRAKNSIHIPEKLLPKDFPPSSQIHIIKQKAEEVTQECVEEEKETPVEIQSTRTKAQKEKAYVVEEIRKEFKGAYLPWDRDADNELKQIIREGLNVREMAEHFGRTKGALESRIRKLGLAKIN
jgi:superfamily I DNA/RNA helicase